MIVLLFAPIIGAVIAAAPSGTYKGSMPLIIEVTVTIGSSTALDMDINLKIEGTRWRCKTETVVASATTITLPNREKTGDCMGDALRKYKLNPSKLSLSINADNSLTIHGPWPDLKLKQGPGPGSTSSFNTKNALGLVGPVVFGVIVIIIVVISLVLPRLRHKKNQGTQALTTASGEALTSPLVDEPEENQC